MRIQDLIGRTRAAVDAGNPDPAAHGLERLSGGMNHDVFASIDDSTVVMKVFRTGGHNAAEHEWAALVGLANTGIAPDPLHYESGNRAIVVMSRMLGSSLASDTLGIEHAWAVGATHRRIHQAAPWPSQPMSHASVRSALTSLALDDATPLGRESDLEAQAYRSAKAWIKRVDVDGLLSSTNLCFSQGDSNLSNYLWTDKALAVIDWEYSGFSDPVLELAGMAEHASTRSLGDNFWMALADATELTQADRARLSPARKAMACFWMVLIGSRQRLGLTTTVTVEEQARRTLDILHL